MSDPGFAEFRSVDETAKRHANWVRPGVWFDQHGREWAAQEHIKSGHPIGSLMPEGWAPPHVDLLPPPNCFAYPTKRNGTTQILYARWRAENTNAWKTWRNNRSEFARKLFKNRAAEAIKEDDASVIELVGPTPLAEEFLAAMERGNRWVLGLSNPATGLPYPRDYMPQWAQGTIWNTLKRFETFGGAGESTTFDDNLFADEDVPGPHASVIGTSARLDAAAEYDEFDEDTMLPSTPVAARSHKKKATTL